MVSKGSHPLYLRNTCSCKVMRLIQHFLILFSADRKLYEAIHNIFGFYPHNIMLYKLALHHKSAPLAITFKNSMNNFNNERLEFLGDAIIGAVVADLVFRTFPHKNEGFMSGMRSKIVSRSQLNKLSIHLGLDKLIQHQHDVRSKSLEGDAFEALFGAIYLDKGYNFAQVVLRRIISQHIDIHDLENQNFNFKGKLLEWSQKHKYSLEYKVIDTQTFHHKKQYIVRVFINGIPMETGCNYNIKEAEQAASEKTLQFINSNNNLLTPPQRSHSSTG